MNPRNNSLITILLSIVLGGLVIGGGVYAYMRQTETRNNQALQDEINTLTDQIADEDTATPEATTSPAATTSPVATTSPATTTSPKASTDPSKKSYTSSKYNFSLSYSKDWYLNQASETASDLEIWIKAPRIGMNDTDFMSDVAISVDEYEKATTSASYSSDTLEAWLKQNKDYQNVKATTLGGRSGFIADAGENKFGGGTYYFIPQKDKSIVKIHDFSKDSSTKAILDSISFAK